MSKLRVFPTSTRSGSDIDIGTNFVTEYNLCNLLNQLLDTTGFVITPSINTATNLQAYFTNNPTPFMFNVKGFYFELPLSHIIYAVDNSNPTFSGVVPADYDSEQKMVTFILKNSVGEVVTNITATGNYSIYAQIKIIENNVGGKSFNKLYGQNGDEVLADGVTLVQYEQLLLTYIYNKDTPTTSDLLIPRGAHVTFEGYKIDDGTLDEPAYGDQSVSTRAIKNKAITTDKIADNAVTTDKINDSAVTTVKIANQSVSKDKIQGQLDQTQILFVENSLDGTYIKDRSIDAEDKLTPGSVVEDNLHPDVIEKLNRETSVTAGSITTDKISNDAITWEKLSEGVKTTINSGVAVESVGTQQLVDGAVTLNKLAQNVLDDGWL